MDNTVKALSPLPRPTWRWLGINHKEIDAAGGLVPYSGDPVGTLPGGVTAQTVCPADRFHPVPSILAETAGYVQEHCNHRLHLTIGGEVGRPVVLEYRLEGERTYLVNHLHITAEPGSRATVVLRYTGDGAGHVHFGHVSLDAGADSQVRLIQVQTLGDGDTHVDAVQARAADGAGVHLLLGELGANQAVSAADVHLEGAGASAELDSLYAAGGEAERDLNYRIVYAGEDTEGAITARGALGGEAKKTLKSTIDFHRGAHRAKGREDESVLVLSDRVSNKSAPLLLCGEDNVEGQHATNIGRPNAAKMYYLMSRGLSEREARTLLVEATFTPLLEKVENKPLRRELLSRIREVTGRED